MLRVNEHLITAAPPGRRALMHSQPLSLAFTLRPPNTGLHFTISFYSSALLNHSLKVSVFHTLLSYSFLQKQPNKLVSKAPSLCFCPVAEPLQQAGHHPYPGPALQPLHHAGHHQAGRRVRRQTAARQNDTAAARPQPREWL